MLHWLESSNSERDCDLFETRRNEARKQLLVFGAKTAIKNSRGKTARDIVTQRARGYRVMKAMSDEGIDLNSVNSEGLIYTERGNFFRFFLMAEKSLTIIVTAFF